MTIDEQSSLALLLNKLGIMGYIASTSIRVGDIYVRPNELQKHLGRYANRFVNVNDDNIYQFQHLGTATGINYRGKFLLLTTNHQRLCGEAGNMGVMVDSGGSTVTPGRMWTINYADENAREPDHDFCVFEYEPNLYPKHPELKSQFFKVERREIDLENMSAISINLGYPTKFQVIDYYNSKVDLIVVSTFVEWVSDSITNNLLVFKTLSEDRFFWEGVSGSPLFNVRRKENEFVADWIGMVSLGGEVSRYGRVISANAILDHIDQQVFDGG